MCLAVPGQVESERVEHGLRLGRVRFGGVVREAVLEHVPEARVGDWVLVHVGFAIARLDPEEAARTLRLLAEAAAAGGEGGA
jgi:hydrogenase expression/formation protein HypC